jgi:hypothetical protein
VALSAASGCFLLARFAFRNLYYLGILLPAALMVLLLVAWLMHLKADGFFGRSREEPLPELERNPERLFATFDDGILARKGRQGRPWDTREVTRALLWAAAVLALASIALYHGAGIGAAF